MTRGARRHLWSMVRRQTAPPGSSPTISGFKAMSYRFHVLGIPHTITTPEYSTCAFTQKVVKLCKMLVSGGHTVIHYGHRDSFVEASEHVIVTDDSVLRDAYGDRNWRKD